MITSPTALRSRVMHTHSQLLSERSNWDAHWREIADYFAPRRSRFQTSDRQRAGSKRNDKIINNTGTEAAKTLASGMMAGLTSPARPWFRLTTPDPDLNEMGDVKGWLYVVEQRMRDVIARSNIYNTLPVTYHELGGFGTGCMILDEDDESVVRATSLTVGSYALATSHRGVVDTLIRELSMTPRQMAARFGEDSLSLNTKAALESPARAEAYLPVIHLIAPNPDHAPGLVSKERKPFVSIYLEKGGDADKVLSVGGYDSLPIMAPRWTVLQDDVYGDSPGMSALGDCRALQKLEDRKLRVIDKISDPPMVGSQELKMSGATLLPGGITYLTGAAAQFAPAYIPNPQAIPAIAAEIVQHERRINAAFFADLFLMLSQSDRRQITAREVEERHEEKLLMLGPVLERLHDELLNPIIDRVFDIMWRRGLIPTPPDALQGMDIRPEYISILAQAQRAVAVGGIERMATFAANLAQVNPEALDKIDFDQSIDEYATALGAPPTMVRTDEKVRELRDARAQQQQAAAMAEQAKAVESVANATKTASETQTGNGSILDQILSPSRAA